MPPWFRGKCLTTLCKICGHHALIPRSIQIPLCYNRAEAPLYQGGFAEVWKGKHEGIQVAVKVLKVFPTSDLLRITRVRFPVLLERMGWPAQLMLITQRFCKEAITWKALRHQNVLPLLGVTMSNNQFVMVSEWMANGNINEFVKTHRGENRFKLVGSSSCCISYLSLMTSFLIA